MATPRAKWTILAGFLVATFGAAAWSDAQFRPFSDHSRALVEGNWQSCRESDGQYGERVYDGRWAGLVPFELHLGPYHEFVLFRGIQDEHRDHTSTGNLLKPFNVELQGTSAKRSWNVDGLQLEVALAGGSREECESWFITLKRVDSTASH